MTLFSAIFSAAVLGFSSGMAPGPLLALTLSETLRHGARAGVLVALAPLATDGPLIVISWFLLTRVGDLTIFLGIISLIGAFLLLYFAWECFRTPPPDYAPATKSRSLLKGIFTNLLNPAPYLFWFTVGTPMLIKARQDSPTAMVLFIVIFFASITGSKAALAVLIARFHGLPNPTLYRGIMRFLGLALLLFAGFFFYDAARYWHWWT
jgi:threonine/homoserine/homoserine lactone efflux protein